MRKLISFSLALMLAITFCLPANAAEQEQIISYQETTLDDGTTIIDEVIELTNSRSTDKAYTRRKTIKDGDITIAIIAMTATFRFDGTSVSVVSKAVTQSNTYDGWEYVQNSFTSSGGTVTLNARLTKWLILNTSFTMTLSCDKDGNISYT